MHPELTRALAFEYQRDVIQNAQRLAQQSALARPKRRSSRNVRSPILGRLGARSRISMPQATASADALTARFPA
jgi:hypothetical protein